MLLIKMFLKSHQIEFSILLEEAILNVTNRAFLVVQQGRLCASNAVGVGSILSRGTRCYMPGSTANKF